MKVARILLILATLCLPVLQAPAQNNKYKIDDSCYKLYRQADSLIGTEAAELLFDQLQVQAEKVKDDKALTILSSMKLRHAIRQGQEEEILDCFENLKAVSLEKGYEQYYFYAYHLMSTHYFNSGQKLRALDYAHKMHEEAVRLNSDYGKWYASKYLAELFLADFKKNEAIKYFEESVQAYCNTDDSTIKVQSMTKVYSALALIYGANSDKFSAYVDKALETSRLSVDTLTVNYCLACEAAVKKDIQEYERYRNSCTENKLFLRARKPGIHVFALIDMANKGDWDALCKNLNTVERMEDIQLIGALAESYGNIPAMKACYEYLNRCMVRCYENQLYQALSETDVMLENQELSRNVIEQKTRVNNIFSILIIIIIAAVIIFSILTATYIYKLKQAKADADEANTMKTHFVQNMSHEIRTPLNAVVGYSQLLALPEGSISNEEREEYCSYINNNSSLLIMLIDDILDLSDIDNGNYRVHLGSCRCNDICRMALKTVECRVPLDVKSSFTTDVPDEMTIESDARRMQQIMVNLLTNSCKFTLSGEIRLNCSVNEKPGFVSFSVTDTGIGIPPEKADIIFQRFAKLDKFKQGSGLGLNICRLISEKLGGIMELDRNYGLVAGKGKGSRFVLHLPVK